MSSETTLPTFPYPQAGTYVIGSTRMGKSSFLAHRMLQDAEAGKGFVLIDPKGAAADGSLADLVAGHLNPYRFTTLDVESANFGINIFACDDPSDPREVETVLDQVMEIFTRVLDLDRVNTPRLYGYLKNSAVLLIVTGGVLADVPEVLSNEDYRGHLLAQVRTRAYRRVHQFWAMHSALRGNEPAVRIESTLSRIDPFLGRWRAEQIFAAKHTTIDWQDVMAQGQIVLVRLTPALEELSNLVGAIVLAQVTASAFSRQERSPFAIYCDEYHRFATPATDELLTMGGGFGMETTIAHQTRSQLTERTRGATLQAGNVVVFHVNVPDNQELAGMFKVADEEPRIIGRMAKQTVAHDPIHQVLDGKHDSPQVQRIAREKLLPWLDGFWIKGDTEGNRLLNTFLVKLMNREIAVGSVQEADGIAEIVYHFAPKSEPMSWTYYRPEDYEGLKQTLRRVVQGDASWEPFLSLRSSVYTAHEVRQLGWQREKNKVIHPSIWTSYLSEERKAILAPYLEGKNYNTPEKIQRAFEVWWKLEDEQRQSNARWYDAQEAKAPTVGRQKAVEEVMTNISWILELGRLLAAQPLMVDTDLYEPMYERQRSVTDRVEEFANSLPGLGLGEAWVKIWQGKEFREEKVTFPPPPEDTGYHFVAPTVTFHDEDEPPEPEIYENRPPI